MFNKHEKMQKRILDAFYGEKELTEELKNHIGNCKDCSAFWESMNLLKEHAEDEPSIKGEDIEAYERIIAEAFREAEKIKEKNKNIRDYIVFILVSVIFLSSAGMFAYMGYGKVILTVQIFIIMFVPILVPFFIKHRLSKEVE
ncbi:MAG TPA: hypothetical protein DCE02_04360 [Ruminiclostridium sp.]|jgi:hypothetical protein|uniref:Zinc-finger domain-containing protein n=1 Tax=Acetivibrio saccincola TaxID=1677857 RepID=A0A2K9EFA1_9FIRM|nr:hypothetical protein [Acetivibrio saccincola]HAA43220.1 hypothetical protein [Ruminiclostridium sp.]AUG57905.1 hypothetical protein HVS_10040 [Acetivibrio saccincola]NLW26211.1 DUF2207 domain-containing protein [Acetivibrio saccincola]PQQ67802.1 hypothetical protein B9R14_14275 [Acetivibrio saccincola]HOA97404.1 hypothetical protein [Acetivibrio saccincola]